MVVVVPVDELPDPASRIDEPHCVVAFVGADKEATIGAEGDPADLVERGIRGEATLDTASLVAVPRDHCSRATVGTQAVDKVVCPVGDADQTGERVDVEIPQALWPRRPNPLANVSIPPLAVHFFTVFPEQ